MSEGRIEEPWTHGRAILDDVGLHYVEAGELGDPLVVLLHGFPEFWYAWRRQIPALADAGFHVVAPDMRGYNRSSKPRGVDSYRLERLTADVVGLIEQFECETATIVGHDWGGVVAWELDHRHPSVVERLVVMNAPHIDRFERELHRPAQLARSWYAGAFQLPKLPEFVLQGNERWWLGAMLRRGPTNPAAFDETDIERYERAISHPGALTAALNYYRAFGRTQLSRHLGVFGSGGQTGGRAATIDVPTLLIWGERDPALGVTLTEGLDRWVPDIRVERLPDASHWVQNDAPDRVNDLLVAFVGEES